MKLVYYDTYVDLVIIPCVYLVPDIAVGYWMVKTNLSRQMVVRSISSTKFKETAMLHSAIAQLYQVLIA